MTETKDKIKKLEFPLYIKHLGYGHMGNLGVFKLNIRLAKDERGRFHANYFNSENTIFDVWSSNRNECARSLYAFLLADQDNWHEVEKGDYL